VKLENILLPIGILAVVAIAFFAYSATAAPLPEGFPLQHQKGKLKLNNIPPTVLPQFAIQENSQWQPIELLTLSIATSALTISP
jgi:hypothetical protein